MSNRPPSNLQPSRALALLAVFVLAAVVALPFIGSERVSLRDLLGRGTEAFVFWQLRAPRVLLGLLAGAALSLAGMAFQSLFRNPLTSPFTLGVSSGAALGAAVAIRCGLDDLIGVSVCAFAGALLTVVLVYGMSRLRPGFSNESMLLAGIAVSFFFSAVILLIQYLSDFTQAFRIIRWLMGGIDVIGYKRVVQVLPWLVGGLLIVIYHRHDLNLLLTGEELAASRGVDVDAVKRWLFVGASLMTGAVVAVTGPIAFVGLIVPHIMRLLVGADHTRLTPACALGGGLFLMVCDTASRTLVAPAEIPVGVITALLGGPFFVWLLLRR